MLRHNICTVCGGSLLQEETKTCFRYLANYVRVKALQRIHPYGHSCKCLVSLECIVRPEHMGATQSRPVTVRLSASGGLVRLVRPRNPHERGIVTATPLPAVQVQQYICQLVQAVLWCHRQQVVHRDIKPENLLINPGGLAKRTAAGRYWTI